MSSYRMNICLILWKNLKLLLKKQTSQIEGSQVIFSEVMKLMKDIERNVWSIVEYSIQKAVINILSLDNRWTMRSSDRFSQYLICHYQWTNGHQWKRELRLRERGSNLTKPSTLFLWTTEIAFKKDWVLSNKTLHTAMRYALNWVHVISECVFRVIWDRGGIFRWISPAT